MEELLLQENGKYLWNPIYGREYFLCHENNSKIHAHYFGKLKGNFVFYSIQLNTNSAQTNENIFMYLSQCDTYSTWYSDGEDEPSFPGFSIHKKKKITNNLELKLILDTLEKMRKRDVFK